MMNLTGLRHVWTSVWPNLLANVVWIPIVWIHHQWVRYRMTALHATVHELRALLGEGNDHATSESPVTTISWGKVFKSPQALISLLATAVTAAGTVGLIDSHLSGAIQTLLVAILGVITTVTHVAVTTRVNAKQAAKLTMSEVR